jgi:DNA ligase D-like protein (predicted ligase)
MGLIDALSDEHRKQAERKKQPSFMKPMLAKLTHETFSDDNWIFERKLDGERCLAVSRYGSVTLYSRNRKKLNHTYPEIVDALEKQEETGYMIDGEVVAFDHNITSFMKLQDRMGIKDPDEARNSKVTVYYYIFDVLFADGHDVCEVPLSGRKKLLKALLDYSSSPVRLISYRREHGEKYHREACQKGWEGVIAKKFDASYKHSRSGDWLKFKCVNEQELVIGGYTDPRGQRKGFGALLVGYYDSGELRYAGKVGTGYDDETLQKLGNKLRSRERETSPFDDDVREKGVHWVTPELVAQVGFTEWTGDNKLRHPRYLGLRRDKSARQVHRES